MKPVFKFYSFPSFKIGGPFKGLFFRLLIIIDAYVKEKHIASN